MSELRIKLSLDVSAVPVHPVGAGRYTIELLHALIETGAVEIHLVARRGDAQRWEAMSDALQVHAVVPRSRPLRLCFEQLLLPRLLKQWGVDLHHGPHYTLPERATLPLVATIHDLTFFTRPKDHEAIKVRLFQRAIRRAVQRAAVLICVSESTREALQGFFPEMGASVVAPHGVDAKSFQAHRDDRDDVLISAAGVDPRLPMVLHLGTLEPRKGIDVLAKAALALIEQGRDFKLVIAGRQGWGGDLLAPYRSALGSVLVETGYLSDDQVPAMLRGARVVAYPAREEGFGLPVLEALACGARVITTEDSVMAEVAKGAAELVPTDDHLALAQAIGRILDESEPSRAARVAAGLAVAAASTWARSAQLHLEAYRLALAIGTNPPKD